MEKHVNYDALAPTYNQRFKATDDIGTVEALRALAQIAALTGAAPRVLEVGCGTARWLADLHTITPTLCGLDLSGGMLAQARQRPVRLQLVRGRAEALPYRAGAFDLVYCVNALHHFSDKPAFIQSARRVLRPGGALAIIGINIKHPANAWYIYDFFAGTLDTDRQRFPSWGQVVDWLTVAGFNQVDLRPVKLIEQTFHGRAVLADPFLQQNACSQLALLSTDEYAAGLNKLHAALAAAEAQGETLKCRDLLHLDLLVAW
jgi:ubiquinone/menaquinone biosynthesis C-methylase UbiE